MWKKRQIAEAALAEGLFDEDGYRMYRDGGLPYWVLRGRRQRIYAVVDFDSADSPMHFIVPGNGRLSARAPAYVTSDGQRAYFCTRDGVELRRATEELLQPAQMWWDEMEALAEKERAHALVKDECPACGEALHRDRAGPRRRTGGGAPFGPAQE